MFKNFLFSRLLNNNNVLKNSFIKTTKRFNFDQYKERSKRHFVLIYRYIDDMHYKRSIYNNNLIEKVFNFI